MCLELHFIYMYICIIKKNYYKSRKRWMELYIITDIVLIFIMKQIKYIEL